MKVECEDCREAVSARLDDELDELDLDALERHLASCPGCRIAAERAATVTRRIRTRSAEQHPDLVDRVVARAVRGPSALPLMLAPGCGCVTSCSCGCQEGLRCRCDHHAA